MIANFYNKPVLEPIVRTLGIVLFPGAVISVQIAHVSRNLEFKGLFLSTLAASLFSGVVSITMAYRGAGVWAMVGQQISYYVSLMLVLFGTVSWRLDRVFDFARIKSMFAFGWKLLCASLIDTIFNNLYGLLIGKIYNEEMLGSYNRGEQFPKLIASNLGAAIQAVLLPVFSARQDQVPVIKQMMRRSIRLSSFVVLPMLLGMFAVADTLVLALLGEPWLICVPFLRIMCVSYCFWPIHITNLQAVNAVGRSDIFLKLEIIKKSMSVLVLVVGMHYSVMTLMVLKAFQDFLCTFVNAAPNQRLLNYRIIEQWIDIAPSAVLSVVMSGAVMFAGRFMGDRNVWAKLFLEIMCGGCIYIVLAAAFHLESFYYLLDIVRRRR